EDTNSSYARRHFFLPVFIGLGILVQPVYIYLVQGGLRADRQEVAQYISSQTENSDKVYAWDNSASVYISSQRLSAATITT
ncbi:quinol oxidase, partial [Streptococcus pyogenes]